MYSLHNAPLKLLPWMHVVHLHPWDFTLRGLSILPAFGKMPVLKVKAPSSISAKRSSSLDSKLWVHLSNGNVYSYFMHLYYNPALDDMITSLPKLFRKVFLQLNKEGMRVCKGKPWINCPNKRSFTFISLFSLSSKHSEN